MSYTPSFLIDNKTKYPKEPALSIKVDGVWNTMNWSEYYSYVIEISKSLIALDLDVGEKSAIYSYNRKEWLPTVAIRPGLPNKAGEPCRLN